MDNRFFERPILNSPYDYPGQHWELDGQGQPTQLIIATRRRAEFITPIPKPRNPPPAPGCLRIHLGAFLRGAACVTARERETEPQRRRSVGRDASSLLAHMCLSSW
jgi:hypothetical protein